MRRPDTYEQVVAAASDNDERQSRHRARAAAGARSATLVLPRAAFTRHARLGAGTVVLVGDVVNVGGELGQTMIVNPGATADQDCRPADGAPVAPGAHLRSGVTADRGAWIGMGAAMRKGVAIGNGAIIDAGALVVAPLADDLTVGAIPPLQSSARSSC